LRAVGTGSAAELGLERLLALLPGPAEEEVDRLPSSGRRSSSGRAEFISPMWSARRWPCRSDFLGVTAPGACPAGECGHRLRQAGG
jgi:hypothetical protein